MVTQPSKTPRSADLISDINGAFAPELQAVTQLLNEIVQSDSDLIREVGEYCCLSTGKKLRPLMTLLAARAFGAPAEPPVQIAAAMEAVHVATLLHDDVIDKAAVRRGRPSVNARWGDDVAILMADYLYAAAFELALHHLDPRPLRFVCQVTRRMCEGEVFQIERRGCRLSIDDYMHLITCKTAYLFSACAALGGLAAGLDAEGIERLTNFGLEFGLAFQITDDTLDYVATDDHWGKSVGIDLATGKQTLPLLLALRDADPEDRRKLESIMNNGRDFAAVSDLLQRTGAIERSLDTARAHARQARLQLEAVPVVDEAACDLLLALPAYVIERHY